jgi:hypothetical protein
MRMPLPSLSKISERLYPSTFQPNGLEFIRSRLDYAHLDMVGVGILLWVEMAKPFSWRVVRDPPPFIWFRMLVAAWCYIRTGVLGSAPQVRNNFSELVAAVIEIRLESCRIFFRRY